MCFFWNSYHWTRNGIDFYPHKDPLLITEETYGTFVIPNTKDKVKYQGMYRCYATNKLGTAISDETEFIVPCKSFFIDIFISTAIMKQICF